MCSPVNFYELVKVIRRVNAELSTLPFPQRIERAREALRTIYRNYCVEGSYVKVIFKNKYGERHITRVEIVLDYTTQFRPLLVFKYPYLQIPK
jgi:hypothetical protein